jgi:hypothetical protein
VPAGFATEAEYVLAQYRAGSLGWLRDAPGVFAFAIVDRTRTILGVDRLGIRPLFWYRDEAGAAFATELGVLLPRLGLPREIDFEVLQEMLAVGFPLSNRTAVRGIERVPPGTLLELDRDAARVTRYWSVAELPRIREQDADTFLDESQERLRHVLRGLLTRYPGDALCLLSAGYDSRRLLLEGHAVGGSFATLTGVEFEERQGRMTSLEPAVTQELCRRLGFTNHRVLTPGVGPMSMETARFIRDTMLDFQVPGHEHLWSMLLVAALEKWRGRINLDGMHGDTLFNNPYYGLPRELWGQWSARPAVLDALVRDRDRWDRTWDGLVSRSLSTRLSESISGLPEGPYQLSLFFMFGRTSRLISLLPYGLLDLSVESVFPYVDPVVMDHAMTFDPVVKGTLRLQGRSLRRHFPAFADIPTAWTPAREIPPAYLHAMTGPPPADEWQLDLMELAHCLSPARRRGLPRPEWKDLAVAALRAAGLTRAGGQWRRTKLRKLLQAAEAIDWLAHAAPDVLAARRRLARAELTRTA